MSDQNARFRRFEGRSLIVTGAAQGVGKQVALDAAAEGGSVLVVDRSPLVEEVAAEIEATHGAGRAVAMVEDLETYAGNDRVMTRADTVFGKLDVLVTNVGGAIWMRPFQEFDERQIAAEISRSLFPTLWGCRTALPYMLRDRGGAIVNVSSIATKGINRIPYSAAKGGVNALTASLAFELAGTGIRVNAVAPGGVSAPPRRVPRGTDPILEQDQAWMQQVTDQTLRATHLRRYGELREIASAILFLASDDASYITGTILPAGGGDQG
ncbi:1,6-dihydroxycyclohexa-2,4-diene-1-carboxylate dehydrogenase [Xanthobacter autotrophicus]|uniref:1,6-dihydroxycyclohexa-2,4-diene-1-carboxylate dehydrogenase n=1 Tax=Xanthobacter autotrophicus TaxID=280 RepID=UPI0037267D26